jgi:hypothetical protein
MHVVVGAIHTYNTYYFVNKYLEYRVAQNLEIGDSFSILRNSEFGSWQSCEILTRGE